MKMLKKLLTVLFTCAFLFGLSMTAFAAEEYNYTVTFYAGNQGSFNGAGVTASGGTISASSDKIVVSGLKLGDVVGFNAQSGVSLGDSSKYYIQGIRLSGRDNDTVAASVFTVTEDADYVVAYGIRGSMTSYTVNYHDENGKALAPSQTFYGNVGDKPVVAYQYIEGFVPNALGLTKTLSGNEADNVFTFVYGPAPVKAPTVEGTGTGTTTGTGTGTGNETTTAPGTTGSEAGTEGETSESETTLPEAEASTEPEASAEADVIVDLDDEEVPMANIDATQKASKLPMVIAGVIGGIGIFALIVLAVTFIKRRL